MSVLRNAASTWYIHCFQVKRSEGFYDRGVYHKTGGDTFWGRGNIQPASQKDTQRLPEGSRTDGSVTVYTDLQLRTVDSPNTVADRIMFNGIEYEVNKGEYWPAYNKFVCLKVNQ